jgi:hypothetical protein
VESLADTDPQALRTGRPPSAGGFIFPRRPHGPIVGERVTILPTSRIPRC